MRIAIFTDTYVPEINGVARTLKRLTQHLEKKGIIYQVFAPETDTSVPRVAQVTRFASMPFLLYPEVRFALPNIIQLKQTLKSFQPTLIHVVTPFNIGLLGLRHGIKHQIPMVASYHTNFDDYLSYYNLEFLNKWIWNYMRWFHRPFEKVFVPSQSTKEKLLNQGIHDQIEIWSRGIDHHLFTPEKRNQSIRQKYRIKEKHIILYVGRLAPEKDIQIAIDAFKGLPSAIQSDSHLVIAGDGPLYKPLTAEKHPKITFTGFIEGEMLAELYASADLFLFPSATETFGNVVLEAQSSGLPVIGANAGGVKELIQNGKTGFLCEPQQVNEFTDAIFRILSQPEKLEYMRKQAREFALSQSWDAVFDKLVFQYEQAISSSVYIKENSQIRSA